MASIETYYVKGELTKSGRPRDADRRYMVRYRKPDNKSTDKRGFRTRREAEIFLHAKETTKHRGEFIDVSAARSPIGTLGEHWLATKVGLKPSALAPLESTWRLYVEPQWGTRPVASIRHSEVQQWVAELAAGTATTKHTKPGTRSATHVIRAYGILAAILDVAVKDRRIASNPARGVELPRKAKRAHPYLTHSQVELLALSAKQHGTLVRFLAYTGERWGEAVEQRVMDLDMPRRRTNVRQNAVLVNGKIIVGTPKNHEARSVPFPAFLAEELTAQCEGKSQTQLVFGSGDAHVRTPSTRDGWYRAAILRAQAADATFPRLTLHDLRHTAASLAVSSGANVKAVQKMLGHASAAMTLDIYADLFDDDLDAVGTHLDAARSQALVGISWVRSA
ncbi:site-specific integrase [Herbiconiux moechotypicola]|uniref:Tyr recombinase domain-containing protein n=1 Tax=Herbiconiux moechotypicola TaxID=637393 RepID=A0ABN3E7C2_9MICO|nr:site-specific integrase [Herbiconiux moechotypicola]MCS5731865.1 site-specific integrase [Herbiconiux moechotypicola]